MRVHRFGDVAAVARQLADRPVVAGRVLRAHGVARARPSSSGRGYQDSHRGCAGRGWLVTRKRIAPLVRAWRFQRQKVKRRSRPKPTGGANRFRPPSRWQLGRMCGPAASWVGLSPTQHVPSATARRPTTPSSASVSLAATRNGCRRFDSRHLHTGIMRLQGGGTPLTYDRASGS